MEGASRSSRKYLVLEVWCGVLTVAVVVMAALLFSIKPRSTKEEVSTLKPLTVIPTANPNVAPLQSTGTSPSYIRLTKTLNNPSWQISHPRCPSCPLVLRNNSIHFAKEGFYFIYAQVTFKRLKSDQDVKTVILKRNAMAGMANKVLVQGTFPAKTESAWVANVVFLKEENSVTLDVKGLFLNDTILTFWGAYELR
ncbi:lymphotoxin-alpha [Gasterosteus aculeatus]